MLSRRQAYVDKQQAANLATNEYIRELETPQLPRISMIPVEDLAEYLGAQRIKSLYTTKDWNVALAVENGFALELQDGAHLFGIQRDSQIKYLAGRATDESSYSSLSRALLLMNQITDLVIVDWKIRWIGYPGPVEGSVTYWQP